MKLKNKDSLKCIYFEYDLVIYNICMFTVFFCCIYGTRVLNFILLIQQNSEETYIDIVLN